MKTKKIFWAYAALAALFAGSLTACSDKKTDDNCASDLVSFETYSFKVMAKATPTDSVDGEIPDYTGFWQCESSGVLPVRVADKDVKPLRDTICALAGISIDTKDKLSARLPDFLNPVEEKTDSLRARSMLISNVSLKLMTSKVMVFDIYSYRYPEGAAHGDFDNTYVNYDLLKGKVLTMADIFKSGYEEQLLKLIRAKAAERQDLLVKPEDVKIPSNFRITDEGIDFVYSIYEITPYSSGEPSVSFYAPELNDILSAEGKALF